MMNFRDDNLALDQNYNRVYAKGSEENLYKEGCILTQYGIVWAYSQPRYTTLHFVHDGRLYIRKWDNEYTPRGLSTLATRFAREKSQ